MCRLLAAHPTRCDLCPGTSQPGFSPACYEEIDAETTDKTERVQSSRVERRKKSKRLNTETTEKKNAENAETEHRD